MMKTIAQAVAIQSARAASGKRGYAKSVRRFCAKREKEHGESYVGLVSRLPVTWDRAPAAKPLPARGRLAA